MSKNSRLAWAAIVVALTSATLLTVTGTALAGSEDPAFLPSTWHVHDGRLDLCPATGWCQHKLIGFFFPAILGPYFANSPAAYQADPARCPNATDKAFLPGADEDQGIVLRAGACFTSSLVIHVRTVPQGTGGPVGWNGPIVTIERACLDVTLCPLQTWETWYLVVPR